MKSRLVSLAILYIRSTFSFSLPPREELKKPKTLAKTIAIGLGILFLVADFSVIFVMMNLTMYAGLKPAGLQELMLLNAATSASVLVFILAFMMAVTALSLPEIIILRKVLKVRLLAVFVGIMTVTIMAVGYLFNAIM